MTITRSHVGVLVLLVATVLPAILFGWGWMWLTPGTIFLLGIGSMLAMMTMDYSMWTDEFFSMTFLSLIIGAALLVAVGVLNLGVHGFS